MKVVMQPTHKENLNNTYLLTSMKVKLDIPDYLTVGQFQKLTNLEHLSELGKIIKTISVATGKSEDEIRTYGSTTVPAIYRDIVKCMDVQEEFHAIFEHESTLYGFQNIDKMSLGEFVDLETLCKEPIENIHEIMAILYRPVNKHNFNSIIFKASHKFLTSKNEIVDVFKHYSLEKYDNETRFETGKVFRELPIAFALGALGFFLANVTGYLSHMLPSSTIAEKEEKAMTEMTNLQLMASIGGGLQRFTVSPKQAFSISQGKEVSLI